MMRSLVLVAMLVWPGTLPGQTSIARWTLTPEVRIGDLDGPNALTRVSGIVVDPSGRIFVLQPEDALVRVFDSSGRALPSLGRRGGGPDEFRHPMRLGWRGDTLWVVDPPARRVSLWHDGAAVGGFQIDPPDLGPDHAPPSPYRLLPDGGVLLLAFPRIDRVGRAHSPYAMALREGRHASAAVLIARLRTRPPPVVYPAPEHRVMMSYQPFDDSDMLRASADGGSIVVVERMAMAPGNPAMFSVTRLSAFGDTIFRERFRYEPRQVTPERIEAILSVSAARLEQRFPSRTAAREALRSSLYIPSHHPPITDVVIGRDHTVWLRREDGGSGHATWLVLDARGVAIGQVDLASNVRIAEAERGRVWAVEEDDWDVPYVTRYRVRPR